MRRKILAAFLVSGSLAAVAAAQTDSSTSTAAQTAQTSPTTTSTTAGTPSSTSTSTKGPTPCTAAPMNHNIAVTGDGVSCKDAHVSKKQQNTIRWYSPKGTTLTLMWATEVPFKSVTCKYNWCKAKGVKSLADGTSLAYETAIDGVKTKDPNVIINP